MAQESVYPRTFPHYATFGEIKQGDLDIMATDDKDTTLQPDNNDVEVKSEQPTETNDAVSQVNDSAKLDEFLASLNTKIDEMSKTYDKKIEDLKSQLDEKTKENEKLKNVNAQILMNTSVSKGSEEIDFNEAEFDDVNWDKEAKQYFNAIDTKIF